MPKSDLPIFLSCHGSDEQSLQLDTRVFYSLNKDNGEICFLDPLQDILPNAHKNAAFPGRSLLRSSTQGGLEGIWKKIHCL